MQRRAFLTAVAGGWVASAFPPAEDALRGELLGSDAKLGHRLRDGLLPPLSTARERADVVVVGGGISGLSAAWRLAPAGLDVRVLELEPRLGGTSAYGTEGVVAHPFGAHYLPVPNVEARAAHRLLAEMGVLQGHDAAGRPRFDARHLCHAPAERIFYQGAFHPGLVPDDALSAEERDELVRFGELERRLTAQRGSDGRPVFQLPIALSSRDPEHLALDRLSMTEWLEREGFRTPFLRWYVRYATLDDYGGEPDDVSAWAGLHYFAARKLEGPELAGSDYLVWPEGNGRLVRALLEGGRPRTQSGAAVVSVEETRDGVAVTYLDVARDELRVIEARGAILACPAFLARRLVRGAELPARTTSPWLVANLHVSRPADPNLPWDTVLYDAQGLGYVDAGHQRMRPAESTVLTYFRAFGDRDVAASRAALLGKSWPQHVADVFADLAPAHPDLADSATRVDLMVWGHAMPRPRPGFLGATPFTPPVRLGTRITWGHVDQSGLALFEEAQARGVEAAETLAAPLGIELGATWL
jgi:glycine/D-amino acid oxidase-like deaminating enzyme